MVIALRATVALLTLCGASCFFGADSSALVVHEWGTFTSLQDENGNAIGGINTDDEPVPNFVHDIAKGLLLPAAVEQSKSVARCHPSVTMRLETPVIYFYPPEDFHSLINVTVRFSSGWITQYFPKANVEAPGIDQDGFGYLGGWTDSVAEWKNIALTTDSELPVTTSRVWNAPRLTNAATVESGGEHEKFLFYRGVASIDAPLQVVRTDSELTIAKEKNDVTDLWLVDVRPDGLMAFRVIRPFNQAPAFVLKTPAKFEEKEYSGARAGELREAFHSALTKAGLFDNEADALLETWQVSYFKSPGLRLFFIVPREWTEGRLPLKVRIAKNGDHETQPPPPVEVTRVMVGRIEIVTPEQRAIPKRIANAWRDSAGHLWPGSKVSIEDPLWRNLSQKYQQLGRFRNALILDERKRNPSPSLDAFIEYFHLQAYKPPALPLDAPARSR